MNHKKIILRTKVFAIIGFVFAIPAAYGWIYLKGLIFILTFPISLTCILFAIGGCIIGINEIMLKNKYHEKN